MSRKLTEHERIEKVIRNTFCKEMEKYHQCTANQHKGICKELHNECSLYLACKQTILKLTENKNG